MYSINIFFQSPQKPVMSNISPITNKPIPPWANANAGNTSAVDPTGRNSSIGQVRFLLYY